MPSPRNTKTSTAAVIAVDPRAAIVDEIGDLESLLAPLKPKQARLDALRTELRASYDDAPGAEAFRADGTRYFVMVGERGDQTVVDTAKLYKRIGWKAFLVLANVTVKALWALPKEVQAECKSTSENTGPRPLKVLAKVKAA